MDAMELLTRRHSATRLAEPGPDKAQLDAILSAALRAPDHGRLRPWRFIVIPGERRDAFGELLASTLKAREPGVSEAELGARARQGAPRARLSSSPRRIVQHGHKIPEVEQLLAGGAAAENVMLAAQAMGFGAMWKTGAPAYDPAVKRALGLEAEDAIVAFLYLGTAVGEPSPAARPTLDAHVTVWN